MNSEKIDFVVKVYNEVLIALNGGTYPTYQTPANLEVAAKLTQIVIDLAKETE